MISTLYALSGFAVGVLVGMTGVGGGSLMTPLLILLFGIHPATAVGTDLLSAAVSKSAGTIVHGLARSIEWPVVRRLAMGSVPATIMTLGFLALLNQSEAARGLITIILSAVLLLTAAILVFRGSIVRFYHSRLPVLDDRGTATATVVIGAVLGVVVTISSVGAGAIGVCVLLILYPKLPMARTVGSDIAHAVPLTFVAGMGHWMMGTVDWHIVGLLLAGSLPGIVLGSYLAVRVPETVLRAILAGTLTVLSIRLLHEHFESGASLVTALTRRAPH